ncbi:hypothetical protein GCM10014713_62810 [Streptomyces purpureus]|uniref:Uncharacterized protein n=1 Tax=Streptomyces purpureus TaxID=1951 RepID=A0A918HGT1_9ACTN|nr:hypothetical protein GCM10014713_62810 [Streptomyces purpureus]
MREQHGPYGIGTAACTAGRPGGSGTGLTRRAAEPCSARAQDAHSGVRGLSQPPQAVGSTSPAISRHHTRMAPLCPRREHPATPVDNAPRASPAQGRSTVCRHGEGLLRAWR